MRSIKDVGAAAKAALQWARERSSFIDHLMRALEHYSHSASGQAAGAITYFSFLSFFPMVALGFAALGYLGQFRPGTLNDVLKVVSGYLPGLIGTGAGQINLDNIAGAAAGATAFGLLGLLYSGLGWVSAFRGALQRVWGTQSPPGNVITRKLADVLVLVAFGLAVLASVAVSSLATSATDLLLGAIRLQNSAAAGWVLRGLALLVAIGTDMLVLLVMFDRLPGRRVRWRTSASGALLGAVLLEILKLAGTYIIARTTRNAVYGTFAVVVGLLVWLNLVSRVVLLSACWAVTLPWAPFGTDERVDAEKSKGVPDLEDGAEPTEPGGQDGAEPTEPSGQPARQSAGLRLARQVDVEPQQVRLAADDDVPAAQARARRPGLPLLLVVGASALGVILRQAIRKVALGRRG